MLTREKYNLLLEAIEPYMCADSYGKHTIGNIYYDTDTYELIRHSIEKPKYKEKLRLRSYGIPMEDSKVYLEIKKKYDGVVYKRRISLTLAEAEAYLNEGMKPQKDSQILREIDYFISFYKPEAKLYLAYDRIAYFGREDPEVRITLDHNIRSREEVLSLGAGDQGTPLLEDDQYLMEIKVPGAMPIWLSGILADLEIYPTSFSKYGNIYKKSILPNRRKELCLQVY
ncbi:MAG: polyphosphate polymerase domain-containing protein [Cellulosilyticum sp.]|nr:polyphosphate polymerase domain-containing protein [Cellulosilyticum sp.]